MGEIRALRDEEWLRLHEAGRPTVELAEESGVSVQLLRRALSRARKERDSRTRDSLDDSAIPTDDGMAVESPSAASRTPWWLELVPLFPVGPFTPTSPCPHHGPIRQGSLLCCMVCSASGMDGHPALARDPATDPRPESNSRRARRPNETKSPVAPVEAETRRQRRSRIFKSGSTAVEGSKSPRDSRQCKEDEKTCRTRDSA
ncbi:MAG: hypothetical protein BGO49_17545 [Planctomycetales bacterium 71-10]|nr:MAG: hypothetical protein BGO49_17545 [Planctomycetales bacterium 71-10]